MMLRRKSLQWREPLPVEGMAVRQIFRYLRRQLPHQVRFALWFGIGFVAFLVLGSAAARFDWQSSSWNEIGRVMLFCIALVAALGSAATLLFVVVFLLGALVDSRWIEFEDVGIRFGTSVVRYGQILGYAIVDGVAEGVSRRLFIIEMRTDRGSELQPIVLTTKVDEAAIREECSKHYLQPKDLSSLHESWRRNRV